MDMDDANHDVDERGLMPDTTYVLVQNTFVGTMWIFTSCHIYIVPGRYYECILGIVMP
jgi:hypothetical protein